ncbi:MAG: 3'-5' exonuclease [Candidatus Aenigmarchaeota archaeon]|nr:3'-5' exonuclease [Candidatus Aenigmarchaeota archaeon]
MLVVDVETTGTDPKKHSVVSIGAIDYETPLRQFYGECRIWTGAGVSLDALSVNGFCISEIVNPKKKTLETIMKEFLTWAGDDIVGGGNPDFDVKFLKQSAEKYNIHWRPPLVTIDVRALCYAHQIQRKLPADKIKKFGQKVDDTLQYVVLPREPKPHNALTGAKMEAEAFSRLIHGKPLLQEFEQYSVPEYLH